MFSRPTLTSVSCLESELQQVGDKLDRGYFTGLVNARDISGDVTKILRRIDNTFTNFLVRASSRPSLDLTLPLLSAGRNRSRYQEYNPS